MQSPALRSPVVLTPASLSDRSAEVPDVLDQTCAHPILTDKELDKIEKWASKGGSDPVFD